MSLKSILCMDLPYIRFANLKFVDGRTFFNLKYKFFSPVFFPFNSAARTDARITPISEGGGGAGYAPKHGITRDIDLAK
jgi:hypothetical protein